MDWPVRKKHIYESLGLSKGSGLEGGAANKSSTSSAWDKSGLGRAVLGPISRTGEFTDVEIIQPTSGQVVTPTILPPSYHVTMQSFSEVVRELNNARKSQETYPLIEMFHGVSQSTGFDLKAQQTQDIWKIIMEITGENAEERKYAFAYLNAPAKSAETKHLQRRIVEGSKRYLESQFYDDIEAIFSQVGPDSGSASALEKVKYILSLKFTENGKNTKPNLEYQGDVPLWAVIYYLVRAGHLREALAFTESYRDTFQKLGTSFPAYLRAFVESPERKLPSNLRENIRKEFNEQARYSEEGNSDEFKFALFKIIGRCEISKKNFPKVIETAEDWLWSHLSLVSDIDTSPQESYTLQNLQATVTEFGAKNFNPDRKTPALYCQILIMCGLFEKAVHYAYAFMPTDAVHFAIALTYYGLLRPITNVVQLQSELLYMNKFEQNELNFARLMGFYTRDFRRSDPADAVEYLVLICLNKDLKDGKGKEHLKMCHEALKELVLETREFSKLLGDVRLDGWRSPGAIENVISLIDLPEIDDFLNDITKVAAVTAEEDGRIADAVLLYQLSGDSDKVMTIINKALGDMLSTAHLGSPIPGTSGDIPLSVSASDNPVQLARYATEVYNENFRLLEKVKTENWETCNTLLRIVNARDAFIRGDCEQCLREINDTQILMLDPNADVGMVRVRAHQSQTLQLPVARNVASLLVMAMRCCCAMFEELKSLQYHNVNQLSVSISILFVGCG